MHADNVLEKKLIRDRILDMLDMCSTTKQRPLGSSTIYTNHMKDKLLTWIKKEQPSM
jgi:predicted house-cleaning noncanonical NTP pyrophosphatase (MazG superfamily)